MLILGIETSTTRSSVALGSEDGVLVGATMGVPQRHGEFVVPALVFCLQQIGADRRDLTGIAVGTGPGLFTGLRVGIGTAQALAAGLSLPTVGMSGMDALAFQVRHSPRRIVVAVDARRKELFWATYRAVPGGVQRETDAVVGTPDSLLAEIVASGEPCLVVGDGALVYGDRLRDVGAEVGGPEVAYPEATHLVELAVPLFQREETVPPRELLPVYLRQADAKIGWEMRGRMRGGTPS